MRRTKSEAERIFRDVQSKTRDIEVVRVVRRKIVDPITKARFTTARGSTHGSTRIHARKPQDWEL